MTPQRETKVNRFITPTLFLTFRRALILINIQLSHSLKLDKDVSIFNLFHHPDQDGLMWKTVIDQLSLTTEVIFVKGSQMVHVLNKIQ